MKIAIVYNGKKEKCREVAGCCREILVNEGAAVSVYELDNAAYDELAVADIIAAVGGDGTILRIAKVAAKHEKPIIGINAGRLGYLACIGAEDLEKLKMLIKGDYTIENRSMIKAEWYKNGEFVDSCVCLNDAVISHGALSTLIDIDLKIDNDRFYYRADGIIAATPSGSTAYSMSAGGPIVDPSLECFILTPVCPHTLQSRPLVINDNKTVEISVDSSKDAKAYLSADGQTAFEMSRGSVVKISNSKTAARFIKLNDVSVYKIFFEKTKY